MSIAEIDHKLQLPRLVQRLGAARFIGQLAAKPNTAARRTGDLSFQTIAGQVLDLSDWIHE